MATIIMLYPFRLSDFLGFLHFDEENMLLTVGGCKELECSPSQLTSGRDFVLL